MIASITDDSRCGMSDVVFRTAPSVVGFSCWYRSDRDFSITVQPISRRFTVSKKWLKCFIFVIVIHYTLLLLAPENGVKLSCCRLLIKLIR